MFTLAISCLTTSNLPWFMDLTFQVPMQYCSLQHQTLLLSPVTSTIGYCFCFGSIPSFFLELFLHWSPVAYWAPNVWGYWYFSWQSWLQLVLHLAWHFYQCVCGILVCRFLVSFWSVFDIWIVQVSLNEWRSLLYFLKNLPFKFLMELSSEAIWIWALL